MLDIKIQFVEQILQIVFGRTTNALPLFGVAGLPLTVPTLNV